jgi:hypothetical protein
MAILRVARLGVLLLPLLLAPPARAAEPDPDIAPAEQTLKEAGVATDGPGLLAYLRRHTLSPADRERLAAAVRQLGDHAFPVRERASATLAAAGRPALPFLKPALRDPDLEVARRAARCLEAIQQSPALTRLAAAVRLLAERRPGGAAEALLAYLPCAGDDSLEEAVFASLQVVGLRGGRPEPALLGALGDEHALRRAAAARVVGRAADPGPRRAVRRLLKDADVRVRYEAATSLVESGEKAAVPALVALLAEAPLPLALQAEDLLYRAAGDAPPVVSLGAGDDESRRRCREGWEVWWQARGARVDLARLGREEPYRGLTLVCEYDGAAGAGRVVELGRDGKTRWQVAGLRGPNDAQLLPGGRVLVAERNANEVTERDRQGQVLWRHPCPGNPIACQRLPGGNTLVCTMSQLYEVTPAGKKLFTYAQPAGFRHAVKTRDGRVVFIGSDGQVGVLDARGRPLRTITPSAHAGGAGYWASVEPLPGDRFLLALGGAGRVVEIDAAGKVVWECQQEAPVFATRLRNGHTLVASFEGRCLIEVDRAGKPVGRMALQGRPFAARRY